MMGEGEKEGVKEEEMGTKYTHSPTQNFDIIFFCIFFLYLNLNICTSPIVD